MTFALKRQANKIHVDFSILLLVMSGHAFIVSQYNTSHSSNFMFTLPSIPTDNFYKFLTISGLALVLYSFYTINSGIDNISKIYRELKETDKELYKRMIDYNYNLSQLNCNAPLLNISSKKERLNIADSILKKDTTIELNLKSLILTRLTFIDTTQQLIHQRITSIINKLESNAIPLSVTYDNYKQNNEDPFIEMKVNGTDNWKVFLFGLVILFGGLVLWYSKNQKIQDKLLEKQLKDQIKTDARPL
jgi:hypothetical protein